MLHALAATSLATPPVRLPDQPDGFDRVLAEHVDYYERAMRWQLDVLRTYAQRGEVRQHPRKDWTTRTGSVVADLVDGAGRTAYGVALILGPSGVIDIDLDHDVARDLAPRFLRPTARFGRKGRVTHYIYRTTPQPHPANGGPERQPGTRRFPNPFGGEKSTILELRRGPGSQTTPPPTIKPDGHPAVWIDSLEAITTWEPEDEQRVEDLALACLIALEPHDGRHNSALRWAGELARRGVA